MYAIPPGSRESIEPLVSGLGCPDCAGVLQVQAIHGGGALLFRCRVGHSYSEDELVAAKEDALETYLWSAVAACEEIAALLGDLGWSPERRARVQQLATRARDLIARDEAVRLGDPTPDAPNDDLP